MAWTTAVVAALGLASPVTGWSQEARSGRSALPPSDVEALEHKLFTTNQALLREPQNPELLLQKGIYLSSLGRLQEAFDVFDNLKTSFPLHPAPYANLASVLARWGKLEEARQMLLKSDALQGNRFQTQVNLASVNLELALTALNKANQLNPGDRHTEMRLRALEKYLQDTGKSTFSSGSTHAGERTQDADARRIPQDMEPTSTPKPRKAEISGSKGDRLSLSVLASEDANKPSRSTPDPRPSATATSSVNNGDAREQQVVKALNDWAAAWASRAVVNYSSWYSADFQPADGQTKDAWFRRKHALIEKTTFIRVDLKVSTIRFSGRNAVVTLTQHYKSDSYTDTHKKELTLTAEDGNWKILREKALN